MCEPCFIEQFEDEVYKVIIHCNLISTDDIVAIGVSGGKDSSALIHCLTEINRRYNCGWKFVLVAVDEGILGYRDESLKCVDHIQKMYNLPLIIESFADLYHGWTMDKIVSVTGNKNSCTYCGTFRRNALEIGARKLHATSIATGHNADDSFETMLMNIFRNDYKKLSTQGPSTACSCKKKLNLQKTGLTRVKPFYYTTQKEIVLYCHYNKLKYFSTECSYSGEAFRGKVRHLVKRIEANEPRIVRTILFNKFTDDVCICDDINSSDLKDCINCSSLTYNDVCKACEQVKKLNEMMYCS